jgi:hypothetical protein
MSSGSWDYELKVRKGNIFLGRFKMNERRQRLFESGTALEDNWQRLFEALHQSERGSQDRNFNSRLGGFEKRLI